MSRTAKEKALLTRVMCVVDASSDRLLTVF
jgi:hypothetical protein